LVKFLVFQKLTKLPNGLRNISWHKKEYNNYWIHVLGIVY